MKKRLLTLASTACTAAALVVLSPRVSWAAGSTPAPVAAAVGGSAMGTSILWQALPVALRQAVQQQWRRSEFFEDTPKEIANDNLRNPVQAWALAFFPSAIVKPILIAVASSQSKKQQWAPFLALVPSMGISHFYETKVYWAGLVALGGDLVGGALLTYYFNQVYNAEKVGALPPAKTMLFAGIGVIAAFWLFENISAPLLANNENKKLRRQFLPRKKRKKRSSAWRRHPFPDEGIAQIGPLMPRAAPAFGGGYTFHF